MVGLSGLEFGPKAQELRQKLLKDAARRKAPPVQPTAPAPGLVRRLLERWRHLWRGQPAPPATPRPRFVTSRQLVTDTLRLVPMLPDVSCVVGVSRSGLLPASLLAMHLHLPLYALDQSGTVQECGQGWRLGQRNYRERGPALVVDDTVGSGTSLRKTLPIARRHFSDVVYATVYCNPASEVKPDVWAADLWLPHILEWNLWNSIVTTASAFDLDGILCPDFACEDDDDGPRYLRAMDAARPLYFARREPITIVTARLEKYREQTMRWLERWGMRAGALWMGPWRSPAERTFEAVAEWKAGVVKDWAATAAERKSPGAPMYFESEPALARAIAERSGVLTVCPATGEVLGPEGCWA